MAGEAIENEGQGFCVGHVAFEGLVGERKSVFVKGDADGDLAAVIAVLLVFSVFGLGVGLAEALEMAVGDIVENDAAAERKKIPLALAQGGLDILAKGHEIVAGAVEAVLGGFCEADIEGKKHCAAPPSLAHSGQKRQVPLLNPRLDYGAPVWIDLKQ